MDSNAVASPGTAASPPHPAATPDLRTEVLGTVLLFVLTVMVTAGVALGAHFLVHTLG